jgi:hypothetical protein
MNEEVDKRYQTSKWIFIWMTSLALLTIKIIPYISSSYPIIFGLFLPLIVIVWIISLINIVYELTIKKQYKNLRLTFSDLLILIVIPLSITLCLAFLVLVGGFIAIGH